MRFVNVRRAAGLEPLADEETPATLAETVEPSVAELVEATSVGSASQRDRMGERGESA
jgi:hypothetical protein